MMLNPKLLQIERIKLRRTFIAKLAFVLPLLGLLYFSTIMGLGTVNKNWGSFIATAYNGWFVLSLPLGIALIAGLDILKERRAGFGGLQFRPATRGQQFLARFAVLAGLLLILNIIFALGIFAAGTLIVKGDVEWTRLLSSFSLAYLGSLLLLALYMLIARYLGLIGSLVVGGIGLFTMMFADTQYWWATPWSWIVRASVPIIGAHPNGLLLEKDSPAWQISAFEPLTLSVGLLVILLFVLTKTPEER